MENPYQKELSPPFLLRREGSIKAEHLPVSLSGSNRCLNNAKEAMTLSNKINGAAHQSDQ